MGLDYFFLIFASTNNPYIYDRTTVTAKDRVAYVCRQANHYSGRYANSYFWRTTQQQEIDYIEECDGQFTVFEMKWNPRRANTQFPSSFLNAYDVGDSCYYSKQLDGMGGLMCTESPSLCQLVWI